MGAVTYVYFFNLLYISNHAKEECDYDHHRSIKKKITTFESWLCVREAGFSKVWWIY